MSFITSLGDWLRKITRSFTSASISGRNITLTRHNGDTVVLTTQDTTYDLSVYALKNGVFTNNDLTRTSPTGKTAIAFRNGTTGGNANKAEIVDFGWDVSNRDGAVLGLRSVSHSTQSGYFQLNARDATNESILQGTPSGDLTWKNNKVITIADEATQSVAGLMSATDKALFDDIPNTYVPLVGNSTISGSVSVRNTAQSGNFNQIATDLTRGNVSTPIVKAAYKYSFRDENDNIICGIYSRYDVTGPNNYYNRVGLYAFNPSTTGNGSNFAAIFVGKNQNGSYTSAPTPPSDDDSTQIATTEWVRDYGDTIAYTHPTTAGNKHIPSGGSSGQILRWSADGTAVWGADKDTTYSLATQNSDGLMSSTDKNWVDNLGGHVNLISSAPYVSSGDISKYLRLFNTEYSGGGSVYLYGRDYSGADAGAFKLTAHNGTTSRCLVGKPDGTLIWDGYNVLTDVVSYAKVADLPSLYTSINFSSTSVPNATFTNLGSFTPSKTGKWLVIINVSIDSNANGYRRLVIANNATGNYPDRFRYIHTDGTTANSTLLQLSWLWNCTSISTVYFNVYQTSGGALNASGGYRAYYLGG